MTIVLEPPARPEARRRAYRPSRVTLASIASLGGLLFLWWLATWFGWISPVFLPAPQQVFGQFATLVTDGYVDSTLQAHLAASLGRVFAALLLAILLGVPAGLLIGLSPIGRGLLDPLIEFLRPIPPLAYLPLVVIWLGIGELSKVVVIAIAMLAPITIATATGVRGVARDRIDAARALGASRLQLVRFVVLPSTLPVLLTGIRIGLGVGWSTLVAAELVAATRGLGFMIQSAAQFLVTDVVLAGIIVIAVVAFALEAITRFIERRFVPWRDEL